MTAVQQFGRSRYGFFLLASLAVLMSAIDSTIVAVAIPQLTTALNAPLTWLGWTLTIYQLVQVVMMPVAGKLSDTLGRKRVFMFCVGAFTIGSLLCALAPSIGFLIAFRAIQAIGGGGVMPSAVGIISDRFRDRRAQAIGLFTSIFPLGGIIGPNIGGYILQHWTWRELFMVNVPLGLLILIGVQLAFADRHSSVSRRPQVDAVGLGLFAGSVISMLYGLTALGNEPEVWRSPLLWGLFGLSILLLGLFIRHIRRASEPVVEFNLLVRSPFWAANLYNFIFGAAIFAFSSFLPYYAVVRYGMTPFESGAVLTPRAITMAIVAALASIFVIRLGYRLPMMAGMLTLAGTMVLLSQSLGLLSLAGGSISGFWLMALTIAVSGLGMGLAAPASNNAALDLAPGKAASITGLRGMFRQTGGIIGIATVALALSTAADKAQALETIFLVFAGLLVLAIPLVFVIPDRARERYLAGKSGESATGPDQATTVPIPIRVRNQ